MRKSQRTCRIILVCCLLLLFLGAAPSSSANVQEENFPGVRGTLYESPTYGWTMIIDPAMFTVNSASSDDGVDYIHLSGWSEGSIATYIEIWSYPHGPDAVANCLAGAESDLIERWPNATIVPARAEYTGEIIYDAVSDYGRMAAYIISDIPGYTGAATAEIICTSYEGDKSVRYTVAVTPASRYDEGADLLDGLMITLFGSRTSEARPGGEAPKIGVLQFFLQCAPTWHLLAEPNGDLRSFYGDYPPPDAPLPADQAYVLHAGWVANIDAIPSVLDLNRLIARFPKDAVQEGANLAYSPAYYGWRYGAPDGASESIILEPGESAVYLVWYVVDRLEDRNGDAYGFSLNVTYEPIIGPPTWAGQTTIIKSETHYIWECGAGGGVRPRVQLGN